MKQQREIFINARDVLDVLEYERLRHKKKGFRPGYFPAILFNSMFGKKIVSEFLYYRCYFDAMQHFKKVEGLSVLTSENKEGAVSVTYECETPEQESEQESKQESKQGSEQGSEQESEQEPKQESEQVKE